MWKDEPITTARELLAGKEWRDAWPAPLVRWLRGRSFGLALDWVFRIAPGLLSRSGSPHRAELLAEVEELRRWRACPPPSGVFKERCEELWYRSGRDHARTAVSHLCMELAQVVCPDLEVGVNWLWQVPSLLCSDGLGGEARVELVEWCIADFKAFAAELPKQDTEQSHFS
jgi:hypothetical protein